MSSIKTIKRYWADWCQPCHAFEKTFNEASTKDKYKNISFESINIEDDEGVDDSIKYSIRSIPTTILFDGNGECLKKIIGNVSLSDFEMIVDDELNK